MAALAGRLTRNFFRAFSKRHYSNAAGVKDVEALKEKDIPYSTTEAGKWKAQYTFYGKPTDTPNIQNSVITGSMLFFLAYFFFLREPNDIDEKLNAPPRPVHEILEELKQQKIKDGKVPKLYSI